MLVIEGFERLQALSPKRKDNEKSKKSKESTEKPKTVGRTKTKGRFRLFGGGS